MTPEEFGYEALAGVAAFLVFLLLGISCFLGFPLDPLRRP